MKKENTFICHNCGAVYDLDDMAVEFDNGHAYCNECACEVLNWCDCCESWHEDETHEVFGRNGNREQWCESCIDEYAYRCDECGDWYHFQNCCISEQIVDGEYGYYCDDCLERFIYDDDDNEYHRASNALIRNYHDNPPRKYYGGGNANYYIGFELEVDDGRNNRETASEIYEAFGDKLYFMRDGSLDNGFEIISQPHTLQGLKQLDIEKLCTICVQNGYKSHNTSTCGLHFHFSRTFFGGRLEARNRAINKIVQIYETHYNKLCNLFRRSTDRAQRWADTYNYNTKIKGAKKQLKEITKKTACVGRYHAVNLTNTQTIEFRLCRGTLNHASWRACFDIIFRLATRAKYEPMSKLDNLAYLLRYVDDNTLSYIAGRDMALYNDILKIKNNNREDK